MGPVTQSMAMLLPHGAGASGAAFTAADLPFDERAKGFLRVMASGDVPAGADAADGEALPADALLLPDPMAPVLRETAEENPTSDNTLWPGTVLQSVSAVAPEEKSAPGLSVSLRHVDSVEAQEASVAKPAGVTVHDAVASLPALPFAAEVLSLDFVAAAPFADVAASSSGGLADSVPMQGARAGDAPPTRTGPVLAASPPTADEGVIQDVGFPEAGFQAAASKDRDIPVVAQGQVAAQTEPSKNAPPVLADPKMPATPVITGANANQTMAAQSGIAAPQPAARLSSTETAWRQKWADGEPANAGKADTGAALLRVIPGKTAGDALALLPDASAPPLPAAVQQGQVATAAAQNSSQVAAPAPANPRSDGATPFVAPVPDAQPLAAEAEPPLMVSPDVGQPDSGFITSAPAVNAALSPAVNPNTAGAAPYLAPTIIEMTRAGNDGPVELALAPEELGRLTISLQQEGDFVRVSMMAERPETLDLLRRHAGDLLADLRQSGFSGASFSFGQGGQQQDASKFGDATRGTDTAILPQSAQIDHKRSAPSPSHKTAGLDLRL